MDKSISRQLKDNMDKDQNKDVDKTREEGLAVDRGTLAVSITDMVMPNKPISNTYNANEAANY